MSRRSPVAAAFAALLFAALALLLLVLRADRSGDDRVETQGGDANGAERVAAGLVPPGASPAEPARAATPATGAAPPVERLPVDAAPTGPGFRGRLLDVATDEPIGFVTLASQTVRWPGLRLERRSNDPAARRELALDVGADGRWRSDEPRPEGVALEVLNPLQGTQIRALPWERLEPDPDEGWVARIAVGPTFRIDPLGAAAFAPDDWRARLVEVACDGVEHEGSWIRLQPTGGAAFLRYDNPWEPNEDGSRFRVDLREEDGTRAGSSALLEGPARGVHPGVVPVVLDRVAAVVTGRVVDTAGEPKDHVCVSVHPLGPGVSDEPLRRALEATTDDERRFVIRGLALGAVEIVARPRRGEPPVTLRLSIRRPEVDVGDLIVAQQRGAGMIRGVLQSEAGLPLASPEYVRLRSLDDRGIELFDRSSDGREVESFGGRVQPYPAVFEFNEAPEGELELSVAPQDGYRWEPASIRVTAPNEEVVFVRLDDGPRTTYAFDVRADGAEVADFDARLSVAGSAPKSWIHFADLDPSVGAVSFTLPSERRFAWTLAAPGMRAVSGDETAFTPPDDGADGPDGATRVARVELRPGFAARLRFRDFGAGHGHDEDRGVIHAAEAPRVDGVTVRADGRVTATSKGGDAWIELDAEPARLAFDAPGWTLVETDAFQKGRIVGAARDVVIWLVRD